MVEGQSGIDEAAGTYDLFSHYLFINHRFCDADDQSQGHYGAVPKERGQYCGSSRREAYQKIYTQDVVSHEFFQCHCDVCMSWTPIIVADFRKNRKYAVHAAIFDYDAVRADVQIRKRDCCNSQL